MIRYHLVSAALEWASNRVEQDAVITFNARLDKTELDYDEKVHMLIALLYHKSDNQLTFQKAAQQLESAL